MEPRFRIVSGLLFFLFVLAGIVSAQVITVQIIDLNTQQGISQKNISLLNIGTRATDRNGLLKINIPPGTKTIELQAPPGFEIATPPGPIMPVPASENVIVKFWVKTALLENMQKEIDQLLQDKERLSQQVKQMGTDLEELQQLNQNLESKSQGDRDSVERVNEVIAQKDRVIDSLQNLVVEVDGQIGDYKLAIFKEISFNYQQFLNTLLDLEDALKNVSRAFVHQGELKYFNETVEALNLSRKNMHERHLIYIKASEKYWNNFLSTQLTGLYDQALLRTYGDLIIPLNEKLVGRLRDVWIGKKGRLITQRKAQKDLKKILPQLRQEIEDMEKIAKEVFAQMKSED